MSKLFFDIETRANKSKVGLWPNFTERESKSGRIFTPQLYPEFCTVAAIGLAVDDGLVESHIVLDGVIDEKALLVYFWSVIQRGHQLIGFNILNFDLPVIFVRSADLGVAPTRLIDRRPWGGQVIDLYETRRYTNGSMGLKSLADAYGIERLPDADGSMVETMDNYDLEKYLRSDVEVTRKLYCRYKGFFCQ